MVDDLLRWLKRKEECFGKWRVVENFMFDILLRQNNPIIIYGAGALGHAVYDLLVRNNITPQYFCSGKKSGYTDSLTGLYVLHKDELTTYNDGNVILSIGDTASAEEKKQLKKDILAMGYKESQIMNHSMFEEKVSPSFLLEHEQEISDVYYLLSDDESRRVYLQKLKYMVEYIPVEFECSNIMYVDSDIVRFCNYEVMIDAGAYNGDSALLFRHIVGSSADIYSFEPDSSNYNDLVSLVCEDDKIYPENLGLWNCKEILHFSDEGTGSSHIENQGGR